MQEELSPRFGAIGERLRGTGCRPGNRTRSFVVMSHAAYQLPCLRYLKWEKGAFLLCAECDGFGSGPASVPSVRSATEQPQITAGNLYGLAQIFNLRVSGEAVQFTDNFLHSLFDLRA